MMVKPSIILTKAQVSEIGRDKSLSIFFGGGGVTLGIGLKIWKISLENMHSSIFQKRSNCTRPSDSRAILNVFEKFTRACFPQIALETIYYYLY